MPEVDDQLSKELDEHIKNVMIDLGVTVTGNNMHPAIVATHNLKARFALEELSFCKIIDYTKLVDPRLSELLEAVHDSHAKIFRNIVDVIFDADLRNSGQKGLGDSDDMGNADKIYRDNQEIIKAWETDKLAWEQEREKLLADVKNLEIENMGYIDKILKHSKEVVDEIELDQPKESNQESNDLEGSQLSDTKLGRGIGGTMRT